MSSLWPKHHLQNNTKRLLHQSSSHWVSTVQTNLQWMIFIEEWPPSMTLLSWMPVWHRFKGRLPSRGAAPVQPFKSSALEVKAAKPQTFWEEKIFVSYFADSSLEGCPPHPYFPVYWRKYTFWAILRAAEALPKSKRTVCDVGFTMCWVLGGLWGLFGAATCNRPHSTPSKAAFHLSHSQSHSMSPKVSLNVVPIWLSLNVPL